MIQNPIIAGKNILTIKTGTVTFGKALNLSNGINGVTTFGLSDFTIELKDKDVFLFDDYPGVYAMWSGSSSKVMIGNYGGTSQSIPKNVAVKVTVVNL